MKLNGKMALILRYFTEFGSVRTCDVVVKSSRLLSHLLMSFCIPIPAYMVLKYLALFYIFLIYDWPFLHVYYLEENIIFHFNSWLSFR